MKVALIVIVSILLVAFAGVFVYGIMQGTPTVRDPGTKAAGDAPDPALFDVKPSINLAAIVEDDSISSQKKTADLLLGAAYNLTRIKQFYFFTRVEVVSENGDFACSEYTFTKETHADDSQNQIKIVQAYTGGLDTYVIRAYYEGQKFTKKGMLEYDNDQWIYSVPALNSDEIENKTKTRDEETPYYLYGVLDFPLDFGGLDVIKDGVNEAGRTEDVNDTMVDPDSLDIQYDEEKGYYTVTFDMIISALNASQETKDRLADTTSGKDLSGNYLMKNITFKSFTVTMEIWKDTGAFRSLSYTTDIHATINSKTGDSTITKEMNFSYDDVNCSVAKKIKGLDAFYAALSDENKGKCDEAIKALEAEKPADAKADEDDDALAA